MCLILLAYQFDRRYPLILAANRDERYDRLAAPASFWEDAPNLLAGRDLLQGGSWLGVTREGRLAAVTNLRDGRPFRGDAPSRGHLIREFLLSSESPSCYLEQLGRRARNYNGFNLIVGDRLGLYSYCSSTGSGVRLSPGIHGVSNHPAESPWPKTVRGKGLLAQVLAGPLSEDDLLGVLSDSTVPEGRQHAMGEGEETELSPIFIRNRRFGTRCSTVILLDGEGRLTFLERTFRPTAPPSTVRFQFELSAPER